MLKNLRYILETYFVKSLFIITKIFPLSLISQYYAIIFQLFGKLTKANKISNQNLKFIYPNLSDSEIKEITHKVWGNLGHTFAEFPFFTSIDKQQFLEHVKVTGLENLTKYTDHNKPVLLFSAHFSNWEVIYCFLKNFNIKTSMIYRKTNNPQLNNLIIKMRQSKNFQLFAKGKKNTVYAVRNLHKGDVLASFIDQRLLEGIAVDFLGKKAMTPPLFAEIANKYSYPLIPIYVKRISNLQYEILIEEEVNYKSSKTKSKQVEDIMININKRVEKWVNKYPHEWFWLHNRWSK